MAQKLNRQFSSVFTQEDDSNPTPDTAENTPTIESMTISERMVRKQIRKPEKRRCTRSRQYHTKNVAGA